MLGIFHWRGVEATASAGYDYYLFGYKRPGYDPVFPLAIQEYKTDANGNVISAGNILKAVPNGVNRTFLATLQSQPAGTELVCYMSNSKERLETIKANPTVVNDCDVSSSAVFGQTDIKLTSVLTGDCRS